MKSKIEFRLCRSQEIARFWITLEIISSLLVVLIIYNLTLRKLR